MKLLSTSIFKMLSLGIIGIILIACSPTSAAEINPTNQPILIPQSTATSTVFNYGEYRFDGLEGCKNLRLTEFTGSPVMLVAFSVSCPHCQTEAESLESIYQDYHKLGLEIIMVELSGASSDSVETFVQTNQLTMPICMTPDREFGMRMAISGVPTNLFFTKEIVLTQSKIGFTDEVDLRKTIDQFLSE